MLGALLGLGVGNAIGLNQARVREERVVIKRVEGGHGRAVSVVVGRALEERPVKAHELSARLALEVVDERALDGRRERHGKCHAKRTAKARAHGYAHEAHGRMNLNGALHHERAHEVVDHVLRHHGNRHRP